MKITIHWPTDLDLGRWVWCVELGGVEILKSYTTRRACIRGLLRWYQRAQGETVAGYSSWSSRAYETVERAIRESRGTK